MAALCPREVGNRFCLCKSCSGLGEVSDSRSRLCGRTAVRFTGELSQEKGREARRQLYAKNKSVCHRKSEKKKKKIRARARTIAMSRLFGAHLGSLGHV